VENMEWGQARSFDRSSPHTFSRRLLAGIRIISVCMCLHLEAERDFAERQNLDRAGCGPSRQKYGKKILTTRGRTDRVSKKQLLDLLAGLRRRTACGFLQSPLQLHCGISKPDLLVVWW
jgi:hypothetical protein